MQLFSSRSQSDYHIIIEGCYRKANERANNLIFQFPRNKVERFFFPIIRLRDAFDWDIRCPHIARRHIFAIKNRAYQYLFTVWKNLNKCI